MKTFKRPSLKRVLSASAFTLVLSGSTAFALTLGEASINSDDTLSINSKTSITDTTQATSDSTGSLTTSGGVGIAKNLYVGGDIYEDGAALVPPGTLTMFAGATAPDGYLLCNGAAVSRTTYADLYAVIGTTYGTGNGTTTFNLPDFRGRGALGVSGDYALGTTGGSSTHTLTVDELPSHTHTGTTDADGLHSHGITDPGHSHGRTNAYDDGNSSNTNGQAPAGDANTNYTTGYPTESATTGITIDNGGSHTHDFTTNATGSGDDFSIMNPYMAINFIIKY